MGFRGVRIVSFLLIWVGLSVGLLLPQAPAKSESSSSNSSKRIKKIPASVDSGIDAGAVTNGVYRNKGLALSCKVPEGWVLRTEEMNARALASDSAQTAPASPESTSSPQGTQSGTGESRSASPSRDSRGGCFSMCSKVLLAAFARPPEAHGEDVNASVLIAAESAAAYPGLKEAAQYFGPLTEVAKAQGFTVDEEPYEIAVGTKVLVRGDFHKDVGTRVMRQSTLAFLSHGYAVSITVIGGTEEDVEDLVEGVSFSGAK